MHNLCFCFNFSFYHYTEKKRVQSRLAVVLYGRSLQSRSRVPIHINSVGVNENKRQLVSQHKDCTTRMNTLTNHQSTVWGPLNTEVPNFITKRKQTAP